MVLNDLEVNDDYEFEESGMERPAKVPSKWYRKRYELFSLFDEGITLTEAGWYSVTPESVALKMAYHITQSCPKSTTTIIDAFAGAGGNCISFARFFNRYNSKRFHIIAIEKDEAELETARHNAKIYNVYHNIEFIHGDCFEVLKQSRFQDLDSVIFASPPWGGPSYKDQEIFSLDEMKPYNLQTMYDSFSQITTEIMFFLPRTSNFNQIASLSRSEDRIPVLCYAMDGHIKGIGVYYGRFTDPATLQNAPTSELIGANSKRLCEKWFLRHQVPPFNL